MRAMMEERQARPFQVKRDQWGDGRSRAGTWHPRHNEQLNRAGKASSQAGGEWSSQMGCLLAGLEVHCVV